MKQKMTVSHGKILQLSWNAATLSWEMLGLPQLANNADFSAEVQTKFGSSGTECFGCN